MEKIARIITQTNQWVGKAAAWLIIPIFLSMLTDVLNRYLVGHATIWTSELAGFTFGVYSVIAGGYLLAERGHVNVDIIYGKCSARRKAVIDLATSFLFLFFIGVLIWQGWDMASESLHLRESSHSLWDPYIWPVKLAIPIAGVLILLQGLVRMVADVRILMGLDNDPDTWGKPASDAAAEAPLTSSRGSDHAG